jgi:hypothetical protein
MFSSALFRVSLKLPSSYVRHVHRSFYPRTLLQTVRFSLAAFIDPFRFHGPFSSSLVQCTLSWTHTPLLVQRPSTTTSLQSTIVRKSCPLHLPLSSTCWVISSIHYSDFGYGCKIGEISRSVSFSVLSCFIQFATLQVHIESYLRALEVTQL